MGANLKETIKIPLTEQSKHRRVSSVGHRIGSAMVLAWEKMLEILEVPVQVT